MIRRCVRWTALVGLLAGLPLAASYTGAQVASAAAAAARAAAHQPRWRTVKRVAGSDVWGISATGPRDAWAIGDRLRTPPQGPPKGGLLLRWNGARWRIMAYPDERTFIPLSVSALSPTDLWLLGQGQSGNEVLHWNGSAWSNLAPLPLNAGTMLVLGDSDIWMAGGTVPGCVSVSPDSQGCSVVSHWDGRQWQSYPVSAYDIAGFAGSSPSNVWAVGESWLHNKSNGTTTFRPGIFRWDGSAWRQAGLTERRSYWDPSIAAVSARDVWVGGKSQADPGACAMRWNGRRWKAFDVRRSLQPDCVDLHTDHRRGMWFGPGLHWTGSRWVSVPQYRPISSFGTNGFEIATVPGGSSAWLYGVYWREAKTVHPVGVVAALR